MIRYAASLVTLLLLVTAMTLLFPDVASFEVLDKAPSIPTLWIQGFLVAGAILLASRWRRWAGAALLPVTALSALGTADMLNDPYIGYALVQEQGAWYPVSAWGSTLVMMIGHLVGWFLPLRRRVNIKPGDAA